MREWKLEFPPEVQAEREPVLAAQVRAMRDATVSAVREAQELALAWLARHPEDYVIWDAGEPVAMLGDALAIMAEKGMVQRDFEVPPEIVAEREQNFAAILELMTEATRESVDEAWRMHIEWLKRYPNDYPMRDLGGSLWMLADTFPAPAVSEPVPAR